MKREQSGSLQANRHYKLWTPVPSTSQQQDNHQHEQLEQHTYIPTSLLATSHTLHPVRCKTQFGNSVMKDSKCKNTSISNGSTACKRTIGPGTSIGALPPSFRLLQWPCRKSLPCLPTLVHLLSSCPYLFFHLGSSQTPPLLMCSLRL